MTLSPPPPMLHFRHVWKQWYDTNPVSAKWVRYMSAMSSSLSRTSVSVASMSLTIEWNSDRLLLCCRRMCSSPLERGERGERGREGEREKREVKREEKIKLREEERGDGPSFRILWSVREVKTSQPTILNTLSIAGECSAIILKYTQPLLF